MKLPSNVLNPLLYRYAYDKVTRIYGTQTSAYRSKQLGGKYAGTQWGGVRYNAGCANDGPWCVRTFSNRRSSLAETTLDANTRVVLLFVLPKKPR